MKTRSAESNGARPARGLALARPVNGLADEAERLAFAERLDCNVSLQAPAGVGKTTAIVDRIVALALHPQAVEKLPRLLVVTYTRDAAEELRGRARSRILSAEGVSPEARAAFDEAFFGTIHSFCLRVLEEHGYLLGLPSRLTVSSADDLDALWEGFLRLHPRPELGLSAACRRDLLRFMPFGDIAGLARSARRMDVARLSKPGERPEINCEIVEVVKVRKGATERKVSEDRQRLRRFAESLEQGDGFLGLPKPTSTAKGHASAWVECLAPLNDWISRCALRAATVLADQFREFRMERGALDYDDQIDLAEEVLGHVDAADWLERQAWIVILDEAQDTDERQFGVLLRAARAKAATETSPQAVLGFDEPPPPGAWAMVGDRQQSIYDSRAGLVAYNHLHEWIGENGGSADKLRVTFRLPQTVLTFLNQVFPPVLAGADGQVEYVGLEGHRGTAGGQLVRLPMTLPGDTDLSDDGKSLSSDAAERLEAEQLAQWLAAVGLEGLRARNWSQVAIICPRIRWFASIASALRRNGLRVQMLSSQQIRGDSVAYAWATALLWVLTHPRDTFEIVGVLRDIFGVSDHELHEYAARPDVDGSRFELTITDEGVGSQSPPALNLLRGLWQQVRRLGPRDALLVVAETIGLRARLVRVGEIDHELSGEGVSADEVDRQLADLLARAGQAEAEGSTATEFAVELRQGFSESKAVGRTDADAIQLLTSHKAKGLEWDAVVVPLFFRSISSGKKKYPMIVYPNPGSEAMPVVLLGGKEFAADALNEVKKRELQSLQRLCYVTCTRARHTLVLVDDEELIGRTTSKKTRGNDAPGADGEGPSARFGEMLLGQNQASRQAWDALPNEVLPLADREADAREQEGRADTESPTDTTLKVSTEDLLPLARQVATQFPRRQTPHALARKIEFLGEPDERTDLEEDRPELDGATPGTAYGTWWHELVEILPWSEGADAWQGVFEGRLALSPNEERSRREWALFLESSLATRLGASAAVVRTEVPFLWPADNGQVLEGVIDLVLVEPNGSHAVIDWKTNQVGQGDSDSALSALAEIYEPQISAYVRVWQDVVKRPVSGEVYSTVAGAGRVLVAADV